MRDNKKDLYNKALKQVPVRNEKIKQEVMKTYDNKSWRLPSLSTTLLFNLASKTSPDF